MKRAIAIISVIILIASILITCASAEDKGTFGSGLMWEFNEKNGELIISGSGDMPDFEWCYYPTEPDTEPETTKEMTTESTTYITTEEMTTESTTYRTTEEMTTESTTYRTTKEMTTESTAYKTTTEPETTGPVFAPRNYYETTHTETTVATTEPHTTTTTTTASTDLIPDITDVPIVDNIVPWFNYTKKIKTVTIKDGVTSIGAYAFQDCTNLTSITISDSVTNIGSSAFEFCSSLTSITIPDSVASIGYDAFYSCSNLTNVTIGNGVTSIGRWAFAYCHNLTSITIGNGVTSIGAYAFYNCASLTSIMVDEGNTAYSSDENGVLFNKDKTELIQYPMGNERTSYTIPNSVTSIGSNAFSDCDSLTSITIPDSVTSIGSEAFARCISLASITIGNGVTSIGAYAFYNCTSLTNITVDEDNTAYSSDEYGVLFNKDKTELIQYPIGNTRTSYEIPDSVTSIGDYAFYGCTSLTSITIPDSVTNIGDYAFSFCRSLTSITIPDGVTNIVGGAFYDCTSLTSITIPDSVTNIGDLAFYYCTSLTSITIPDSVTSIGNYAFVYCDVLESITIPDSVTSIGDFAFYGCDALDMVFYSGTQVQWEAIKIGDQNGALLNAEIHFGPIKEVTNGKCGENLTWTLYNDGELVISGTGEMTNYTSSADVTWDQYRLSIRKVTIEDGVTSIGDYAFWEHGRIGNITIPDSVTSIGEYAIKGCQDLTSITVPESVVSIGEYAFFKCDKLTDITIPKNVTYIGAYAFYICTSLTSIAVDEGNTAYSSDEYGVLFNKDKTELIQYPIGNERTSYTIPDSVTSIGSDAFYYCTGLTSITIPDSVTSIGDCAFYRCTSLTSITIPNGVKSIGEGVFTYCTSLTNITVDEDNTAYSSDENRVLFNKDKTELIQYPIGNERTSYTIPDCVTDIGSNAFYNCDSLTNITIPNGVTSIGNRAFSSCNSLTSITIPDSVTNIGDYAFYGCGSLTSITIGNGVTSIGDYAFYYCDALDTVYYGGTQVQWEAIYIGENNDPLLKAEIVFLPIVIEELDSGICGENLTWTLYNDGELVISGKGEMTNYTSSADVPWDRYRSSIRKATIEDGVTSIGNYAFAYCDVLESITIPDSVTSIGDYAFYGCGSLTSITIPDSVTSIGDEVFECCFSLTSITVDEDNTAYSSDEYGVLFNKDKTELIQYPKGNTRTSYEIPDSVTSIGDDAFSDSDSLTSITIPDIVTSIGADAFYNCNSLTTVYYNGTQEQWKAITIRDGNEPLLNAEIEFEAIPEHDCSYVSKVITQATCTTSGKKEYTCTVCGDKYTEIVYATGHEIEYFYKEPTCTETGYEYYGCINCDAEFERTEIDVLGHIAGEWETIEEPTCSSVGSRCLKCTVCGIIIAAEELPMIPHTYEESVITAPTCVEEGTMRFTCTACGDSYDEVIPATGEHKTIAIRKEPTCIKFGTEQYVCEICGNLVGDLVILPKGDHSYGEWTVVKDPTATEEGTKEHSCTVCGKTEVVAISATGFEIVEGVIFDFATNTISGLNAGETSLDSYTTTVNDNYTWEYVTSNGKLGTGSKAILKYSDTVIGEYTILVYGDTNGDSWYDGQDAVLVSCLANGMLTKDDVSEAVYMAADCNHDGVIDQLDVDLLNEAGMLLTNVDQSKPAEVLLETSSEYVEYLSIIDQSFEIEDVETEDIPEADAEETPETDNEVESEDTTPEQDAKVDIFEMIMNFIKSIFEMLFACIPVPLK